MILSSHISWSITMCCCVKTATTKRWRAIIVDDLSAPRALSDQSASREGSGGRGRRHGVTQLWDALTPIAICNTDPPWHMNAIATCCCNSVSWDLHTAGAHLEFRKERFNYIPILTSRARVRCWNYLIFFVISTILPIFTPKWKGT